MQMFPFTAARLKADIQRAACNDVGMHTPTHWQRVVVRAHLPSLPCCSWSSAPMPADEQCAVSGIAPCPRLSFVDDTGCEDHIVRRRGVAIGQRTPECTEAHRGGCHW